MDLKDNIVCITTFRQGDMTNQVENVRAKVYHDTVLEISKAGLQSLAVYIDTQKQYLEFLQNLNVITVRQKSKGMGNIRREAINEAILRFPWVNYFCWLEPEKPDIIKFIPPLVNKMERDKTDLGIFNRKDMSSYPPEQSHYYQFCRAAATQFVGFDFDYAFGPMIITRLSTPYFMDYNGEYGDKWDSILIPRLRIIKSELTVSVLPIDFKNDKRMTRVESGNPAMILKRLEQFNNVIPSLVKEWSS